MSCPLSSANSFGKWTESKSYGTLFFWIMDETQQQLFYTQAMIPEGVSLELDDFETFYNERKKLLVEKIRSLVE